MYNLYTVICSFLKSGFHSPSEGFCQEKFVFVVIPTLLPFSIEEFVDFGFQISEWNFDFVRSYI